MNGILKVFVLHQVVDVDRLFTNTETVCEVSAGLLHRLHKAVAEPDPEAVVIGNVMLTTGLICTSADF